MNGHAHANLEDLERLKKDVSVCVDEIQQALKKLNKSLDRADWRDQARTSFEQTLKEATSQAGRTADRLNDLTPILNKKVNDLKQYLGR